MAKIEKCSCEETEFLRGALSAIKVRCEDGAGVEESLAGVFEAASDALSDPTPGGELPCSCSEALHLRRALQACANVAGSGGTGLYTCFGICDDLSQCNNFAYQGLTLSTIDGDPAVYDATDYIPKLPVGRRTAVGHGNRQT